METPIWACKTAQVPKPQIKQTQKQIEEISHENCNATSEKCFSQMCSCTRPVRTLEYN